MKLSAPDLAPKVQLRDIEGNVIKVGEGRPTLLAFFRDAACPFCNMQLYKLTQQYEQLSAMGLDIVAVFASTPEEVKKFILARPRPFPVAAEPSGQAYEVYGVQRSFWKKLKAVVLRFPMLLKGLSVLGLKGALKGMAGVNTSNIMPADFLIDENGKIVEAYYGKDAGDHIPMVNVEAFLAKYMTRR